MMTDDARIVDALRADEPGSVQALIDAYGTRLVRSACLLCGNATDAQDIVQDTLITAVRSIRKFRGKSRLYTWLHGILINITRHSLRTRRPRVDLDDVPEPSDHGAHTRDIENSSLHDALMHCVRQLSQEHRDVVVLRYFEEMTLEEISAATGARKGTVKSRLHYAIEKLREILPPDMEADAAALNRAHRTAPVRAAAPAD